MGFRSVLYREKGVIIEIAVVSLSIPQAHGIAGLGPFYLTYVTAFVLNFVFCFTKPLCFIRTFHPLFSELSHTQFYILKLTV